MKRLAEHILNLSYKHKLYVTNMHLNLILYFIFIDGLYKYPQYKNLLHNIYKEEFVSTYFGPQIESVYNEYKSFRAIEITEIAKSHSEYDFLNNLILELLNVDKFSLSNESKTHNTYKNNSYHFNELCKIANSYSNDD